LDSGSTAQCELFQLRRLEIALLTYLLTCRWRNEHSRRFTLGEMSGRKHRADYQQCEDVVYMA